MVVAVATQPVVTDFEDASSVVVITVTTQGAGILANFAHLVPDVVEECGGDAGLGFGSGVAIWVNGNDLPVPKIREHT